MEEERSVPIQKIDIQAARFVAMVEAITTAGIPVSEAPALAKQFLCILGAEEHALIKALSLRGKHDPVLIMPHPVNPGQFVMEYFPPAASVGELWQKIRDARHRGVIIFDFNEVYVDYHERLTALAAK